MVKTINKKNKRNNKTSKKLSGRALSGRTLSGRALSGRALSGRALSGGKPLFIKTVARYKDGILVKYLIQRTKMDEDQQRGYANLHKVFYPLNEPSSFLDIFKIDPKKMKLLTKPFFSPPNTDPNNVPVDEETESQTIVINSFDDRNDVKVANQIIQNINNDTTIPAAQHKYDGDIPTFIDEYKKFIERNKRILLLNTPNLTKGTKMLNTPVFLNIIGKKYGYITNELPNLEELQTQMFAPSMATTSEPVPEGPAAIPRPVVLPKHIQYSKKLKEMIANAAAAKA
jgi:hypothetical protein